MIRDGDGFAIRGGEEGRKGLGGSGVYWDECGVLDCLVCLF